jgi:hypothetical protein
MQEAMVASGQEPLGISLAISKKALSSKINSAPADYILVDGQSFRVSRSPRSEGLSPRAAQQAGQPGHEDRSKELQAGAALLAGAGKTAHITRQEDDTSWLRRQLAEANAFIEKQRKELQGRYLHAAVSSSTSRSTSTSIPYKHPNTVRLLPVHMSEPDPVPHSTQGRCNR